jgi:CubicO group peptidase (beta-lactamase class C family)
MAMLRKRVRHPRLLCITAILALGVGGSARLESPALAADKAAGEPDFAAVRTLIQQGMVQESVPGLSVAVVRRGEILWEEGFGWADREHRVPADEHTPFFLASVSKTITATALMILQERKRLDLDHPVNEYIGPAKVSSPLWNTDEATIRRIATHTAGLTTFDRTIFAGADRPRISFEETVARYGILFWRPGDHFDYSNLGYGILGEAVARASGRPLSDFLRQEVFVPLGMMRTSLDVDPQLEKLTAARYSLEDGRRPRAVSAAPGASVVYGSAHDLALFGLFSLKAHLPTQKRVLSDASIDAMQSAVVKTGDSMSYGLGWWSNPDLHGYRSLLAQGGTYDSSAWLELIPSEGIAVVVLVNTGTLLPKKVIDEVLSVLLPQYRQRRATTNSGPAQPQAVKPPSPSLAGTWSGTVLTYHGKITFVLWIAKTGEIRARMGTQLTTLVNNAAVTDRDVSGLLSTDLGIEEDADAGPYDCILELYRRDDTLYGALTAQQRRSGARQAARLPLWVELTRQPDAGAEQ